MKKFLGLLGTFVAGAGAGVALGLLYAPEDGKTTREKLSFKLSKLKEKLQKIKDNGISEFTSVAKTQGQQVVKETTEKAEIILKQLEDMIGDLEEKKD